MELLEFQQRAERNADYILVLNDGVLGRPTNVPTDECEQRILDDRLLSRTSNTRILLSDEPVPCLDDIFF